jgi:hypothetical protein
MRRGHHQRSADVVGLRDDLLATTDRHAKLGLVQDEQAGEVRANRRKL